ncbi:MAG: efflux RND transporter permease subunit [Gammaproteobacteria bacterium]|nr:efflux RND transporter permease subunit [Gammaproteobacteria bacterium]
MRLVDIATERRITVLMVTLAIVLFGLVSLSRLRVNLLPDLSYPTITVRTELLGAAPLEIENLISKPIEESVGVIKNVRRVLSVSRSGQSDVIIEFIWGTEMDFAGVDVREKLDLLDLPDEAARPLLLRFDPSNDPILRASLSKNPASPGAITETQLRYYRQIAEEQIKNALESVEGTAAVKVSGGLEEEIQVLVDQQRIAQLGISIGQINERLRAENVNLSGGRLEDGTQRYLVRTINEFKSIDEIGDAIIPTAGPQTVYLRDIATITNGNKERQAITRVNGRESVELAIYKEGDANTVHVAEKIKTAMKEIRKSLPDDMQLDLMYDESVFISGAVKQVQTAAAIGGLLAILVLYFFLRNFRSTVLIAIAIPVSVIGTFILMYLNDVTLNIMSLGGIALAIGLLVDNSIVVLENIFRNRESGMDIYTAARTGTSEVAGAVIAATLTTIAVFFPMVFITGIAGQLFRDQALTVTFALLFSLLVALTLIPMLSGWEGKKHYHDHDDLRPPNIITRLLSRIVRFFGLGVVLIAKILRILSTPFVYLFQGINSGAARLYKPALAWSLRHRLAVIGGAVVLFAGAMSLLPRLGTELIPQLSQGEFIVDLRLPAGTTLEQSDATVQKAFAAAQNLEHLDVGFSVAGSGNRLDASPVDSGENTATLNIRLKSSATSADEETAMAIMRDQISSLAGVQYKFSRPELFTFSTPIELEITGFDLAQLERASDLLVQDLRKNDRFADIKTTVENGNPEIQVVFDHERIHQLGLVARDVADTLVAKVRGSVATRYSIRDRKVDILVRSVNAEDATIEQLRNLIINPLSARPVTLSTVADVSVAMGPTEIRRSDQERVALISANITRGDLGTAVDELQQTIERLPLPANTVTSIGGQNSEMQRSFSSMIFTLLMAVFLVYLVMAAQFESVIHPFVILFTIPLAFVGAIVALFLTGTTINVVVFIGAIMLAGIVVNNAIVLIDLINQMRADGVEKLSAIKAAGHARLRPILMTTLTTALGLLPMAIGFGQGSEIRAPMAITVIGGLLMSTLLTLVVIPVVYSLLDRKQYRTATRQAPA